MKIGASTHKLLKNNNILSLASNAGVAGFRLFTFMLLARYFTKTDFGEWVLFLSASGLVEMVRYGVTRTAMVRYLSGSEPAERKILIGSNWTIGLIFSVIVALLLVGILLLFPQMVRNSGYHLFFVWYPLMSFVNLPFNNALTILQSQQRFASILLLNAFTYGTFFIFVLINFIVLKISLNGVVMVYLGIFALSSLIALFKGWDGLKYLTRTSRKAIHKILNFGKYSLGTLMGSNLLKNADTIIIGLSPLGTEAVALYSIPLKLTELLEIPLRSFSATAFPRISKASMQNKLPEVRRLFYSYSGTTTLMFIPAAAVFILFAPFFIKILGGAKYLDTSVTMVVFQLFAIYSVLAPLEKFGGIALDSINKPRKNFYKVMAMALLNVIGDLVAVFYFNSLIAVAAVTILFTIFGQLMGWYFLKAELNITVREFIQTEKKSLQKKLKQAYQLVT